jgi:bifunctional non-homologous end joining protein LigD
VALEVYRKKRKFGVTAEPRGRKGARGGDRYVIQKHAATRLHYDLRLELDGVMKSWAVTRGPSLDPNEKRLAVHVEDHPIEYNTFEGTIPKGEYGGGTVMIWDRGRWSPEGDGHKGYAKGHLVFDLDGEKLHGRWHLVRMRSRPKERHENWLLIKGKDDEARGPRGKDILEEEPRSAVTGRSLDEIAAGKGKKRVWHSNRSAKVQPEAAPPIKAKSSASPRRSKASRAKKVGTATRKPKAQSKAASMAVAQVRGAARGAVKSKARPPEFVPPSLATLHETAPSGTQWIHEIKFDGYRIQARLDDGDVRLLTRKQQDWTHRFKIIADAVAELSADTALIDGELVVEDENGISSFSQLQTDLKEERRDGFVYYVFDLLFLDGRDLTAQPLIERKAALKGLLKASGDSGPIRLSESFEADGATMLDHACRMHLEGIVSKRKDAPYSSGRSENFIKSKCSDRQEFVVAGFTPSTAEPRAVGALTVGVYTNGKFTYAGRIGTGYSHAIARDLWKRLEALRADKPPFVLPADERRKNVIWVKPQMVIEAEFRGWTHGEVLRQASFKGLREDKAAKDVVREVPEDKEMAKGQTRRKPVSTSAAAPARKGAARKSSAHTIADVTLTHPDRVYWADVGVTKENLAEYYVAIWDWIAPHVVRRPLALVRCPDGTAGQCFFQKHVAAGIKDSKLRHVVKGKDHDVIAVEHVEDLVSLVQSGVLEIHTRGSTLENLETCDRIVFDLDPGDGVTWAQLVAAAREVRKRLEDLKLESFVKLSGGKGLHVVLPIDGADWNTTKNFTQKIAMAMSADSPKLYVAKMTKSLRDGRIFIDYLRNSREATSVAPYSSRARAGAPVSAPLSWEELGRTTSGGDFTVLNLQKRLARLKRDPWADIGRVKQKLPDVKRGRK